MKKTTKRVVAKKSGAGKAQYVILRAYSGVFFGRQVSSTLTAAGTRTVELADARQIWNWGSAGLTEKVQTCGDLSVRGVGSDSKVSSPVGKQILDDVKATFFCTPEAISTFDGQKWGSR